MKSTLYRHDFGITAILLIMWLLQRVPERLSALYLVYESTYNTDLSSHMKRTRRQNKLFSNYDAGCEEVIQKPLLFAARLGSITLTSVLIVLQQEIKH
jgi:hypothetical protein